MTISAFDLFKIGIGPSSSHTVGPMRAALMFAQGLERDELLESTASVKCELYGSLGATGKGHGTDRGVMLGLMGDAPDTVDASGIVPRLETVRTSKTLALLDKQFGLDYPRAVTALSGIATLELDRHERARGGDDHQRGPSSRMEPAS